MVTLAKTQEGLAGCSSSSSSSSSLMQATMASNPLPYIDDLSLYNMMMPLEDITTTTSTTTTMNGNHYASIDSWIAHELFDGSAAAMAMANLSS